MDIVTFGVLTYGLIAALVFVDSLLPLVPVGRTAVAFVSGTSGISWRRYVVAASAGSATWAIVMTGLGRVGSGLTENVLFTAVLGLFGGALVGGLASLVIRRRRPADRIRPIAPVTTATTAAAIQSWSARAAVIGTTSADDDSSMPAAA